MSPLFVILSILQCTQPPGQLDVNGSVLDARSARPLVKAEVRLVGSSCMVLTDSRGRFSFRHIAAGEYVIESGREGYTTVRDSFIIAPGASVDVEVRLDHKAIAMEPLVVVARSPALERLGFYDRRSNGNGAFMTRAEIERFNAGMPSDLVRRITGLRLVRRSGARGYRVVGRNSCPFSYVIDGISTDAAFELDDMEWHWIEGLEVYSGLGQIPPQFAPVSPQHTCGVIVVWTRSTRRD